MAMNMTYCHDQKSNEKPNGVKSTLFRESVLDGMRVSGAVGPAFLYREGVQYGSAKEYQEVIIYRTWSAAEAKVYPCT